MCGLAVTTHPVKGEGRGARVSIADSRYEGCNAHTPAGPRAA